jgi:hypothetical protein
MIYSLLTIALLSLQAIASMGGAFLECNALFAQLSDYTKQELCALTIFNLTARQDLQAAFDQISQLLSYCKVLLCHTCQEPIFSIWFSNSNPSLFRGTHTNGRRSASQAEGGYQQYECFPSIYIGIKSEMMIPGLCIICFFIRRPRLYFMSRQLNLRCT